MARARRSRMSRVGTRKQARVHVQKPLKEPTGQPSHKSPRKSGYFVLMASAALHRRRGR